MAQVRINGTRFPILQSVRDVGTLISRIELMASKDNRYLTHMAINGKALDLESPDVEKWKVENEDVVDVLTETPESLALQSLQVAQEMGELLAFDIKVATLHLWDNTKFQVQTLHSLLKDCQLFLSLGSRPIEVLGRNPREVPAPIMSLLGCLDSVADHVEDTILLATAQKPKEACHVLIARVLPALKDWLERSTELADYLHLKPHLHEPSFEYDLTL